MLSPRRTALLAAALTAVSTLSALAQRADIPLRNWTVPPYSAAISPEAALTTMSDISPGVGFVAVTPCRIVDTRGGGVFTGAYGPPALVANTPRNFDLNSATHCPGLPAGLSAYSLNFTVTDTGAGGDLRAWPQDNPPVQVTSVLNWTAPGTIVANAIIVPAGTGGGVTVTAAGTGANVLIDVNGYFTGTYNTGVQFLAIGSIGGNGMIAGINSAAVNDSAGVSGTTTGLARTFGVLGITSSNPNGSAGVKGVQGAAVAGTNSQPPAGVVGTSPLFDGVLGITQGGSGGAAVRGSRINVVPETSGELGAAGLGGKFTGDVEITGDLDVLAGFSSHPGNGNFDGNLTATNLKSFIEPHPTDASKAIRFVSLEGPESGTYFRGRARFQNGTARIAVPEEYRLVTSPDGLTVQITPIGGMATFGVIKLGLDEIVVQGSRNLEFSYLVQGVRKAFQEFLPLENAGIRFVRSGANSTLSRNFPLEIRNRLIANGTYKADGTVNMDTARRLGWDRVWETREHGEPAPVQPNP